MALEIDQNIELPDDDRIFLTGTIQNGVRMHEIFGTKRGDAM